jgi:hypothetical protein
VTELDRIRQAVEHIYVLLVQGQYSKIEDLTRGVRLYARDIETAMAQYQYPLAPRPAEAPIDAIEITGSSPRAWSVRVDGYTAKEGRSDLSLELTVVQDSGGSMHIELDNLHVL